MMKDGEPLCIVQADQRAALDATRMPCTALKILDGFWVLKEEAAAWAFSCIAVVAILVPLSLAYEQQHVDEIQPI